VNGRYRERHRLTLGVGYVAVLSLLGLVAGGSAVFAIADPVSGAIAFASSVVFALLVYRVLWVIRRPVSELGDANGGGGGGGGRWSPQGPRPWGTDDRRVDWERFERDFRAYTQRRESVGR